MMRVLRSLLAALAVAALAAPVAAAEIKSNWHVHDGVNAPILFFPAILTGGNTTAYLADPAHCADATDKRLVGPAGNDLPGNQPAIAGMCQTSDQVIHLKVGAGVPDGWSSVVFGGTTWYYKVTDR